MRGSWGGERGKKIIMQGKIGCRSVQQQQYNGNLEETKAHTRILFIKRRVFVHTFEVFQLRKFSNFFPLRNFARVSFHLALDVFRT